MCRLHCFYPVSYAGGDSVFLYWNLLSRVEGALPSSSMPARALPLIGDAVVGEKK